MIDFRYHLVSIIAVFFALAVGIVLGAGPLGERVDADLPEQLAAASERSRELQDQIRELEAEQEFRDGFIDEVAADVVGERLTDEVAVVVLPDADGDVVDAVDEILTQAGATVTATVRVEPEWTEPEAERALDALAAQLVTTGTTLPESGDGHDRGAALLAGALVTRPVNETPGDGDNDGETQPSSPTTSVDGEVLVGLTEADFISVAGEPEHKAKLAVVIAGPDPELDDEADDAEPANVDPYVRIVVALERAGVGVVVANPSSVVDADGLVGVIRSDGEVNERVSTVDSVALPAGRVALVFALAEQAAGGAGQYGGAQAADGFVPPVPDRAAPPPFIGDENTDPPPLPDSTDGSEDLGDEGDAAGGVGGTDESGEGSDG